MNKILIRCDGGTIPEIGTGHVVRMLRLADELCKNSIIKKKEIYFLTRRKKKFFDGYNLIKKYKFKIIDVNDQDLVPNSVNESKLISKIFSRLVIIDRLGTSEKFIKKIKSSGSKVITFEDEGSGKYFTDMSINAILKDKKSKQEFNFNYLLFGVKENIKRKILKKNYGILTVCFGGYDHRNLTKKFIRILKKIKNFKRINIIIGDPRINKMFKLKTLIRKDLKKTQRKINLLQRPKHFYDILVKSDLAIISGGLIVFECAHLGVPTISIPQYPHQMKTIKMLSKYNITKLGSQKMKINFNQLSRIINKFYSNKIGRDKMSRIGPRHVDGRGMYRVSLLIRKILQKK